MLPRGKLYAQLTQLALDEYGDIVEGTKPVEGKLRLLLVDSSFIDIWLSVKKEGTYAYHWERQAVDGTIYRYNNLPDKEAKKLSTYPDHFHKRDEKNILESDLSGNPIEDVKHLLDYAREIIH